MTASKNGVFRLLPKNTFISAMALGESSEFHAAVENSKNTFRSFHKPDWYLARWNRK